MALERALAAEEPSADLIERLVSFDAYIVLLTPQGSLLASEGGKTGLVFTTLDALDLALAAMPAARTLKRSALSGSALFPQLEKLGIDELVLNGAGPTTFRLDQKICQGLAHWAVDRAELARLEAATRRAIDREEDPFSE
jgi:hypothetical protein